MPISLFISTEIGRRTYGSRPDIPAPRLLGFAASRAVGFTALTFQNSLFHISFLFSGFITSIMRAFSSKSVLYILSASIAER